VIVIAMDGGLVQSVSTDDPRLAGEAVAIIDYDAEGADPDEVHLVPQGEGDADEEAVIGFQEVGTVHAGVGELARDLLRKAQAGEPVGRPAGDAGTVAARTGLASTYERGDVVETPLGVGTIDTDPDEHGRCMVVPERPLADGTTRFSATTFQFGRIVRKWNAKEVRP